MSQFILDDQLKARQVLLPLKKWTTAQFLRELRPNEHILDDRVPAILQGIKQPSFITIDQDFWDKDLCHPAYAVLYFALRDDQQELLPGLLRSLVRRSEFRARVQRMGKVARVSSGTIDWWEFHTPHLRHRVWKPASGSR